VKLKPTPARHRLLPLVPKVEYTSKTVVPLRTTPSHPLFANDLEFNYFKVFADTTAPNLGEYLDTPIWGTIVLQASEQEHFIKHAIIALGALNKCQDIMTINGNISRRGLISGTPPYQVAFQHYGSSIQGIRKACQEQRKSRRTILIACLLAICFEYYHGNMNLAIVHVKNGIRLSEYFFSNLWHIASSDLTQISTSWNHVDAFLKINANGNVGTVDEWFLTVMHLTKVDGQQFLQGIIEDELISIFTRLEHDMYLWHQSNIIEMHPELQKIAAGIIRAIPTQGFNGLHTARRSFDILLTQVDRFVYNIDELLWDYSDSLKQPKPAIQFDNSTCAVVPSIQQQQRVEFLKQGLTSWRKAFQPVLSQSIKLGGKDLLVAKTLALNFICSAVALHCCFGPELTYDAHASEFQAALSIAGTLFDVVASKKGHTFIVSSIIIKSLFFIASKCRETSVRTKARNYLRSVSRQEGIWDSTVLSTMATAVMKLEESEEHGLIEENRRLRAIRITFDLHTCQGKLMFLTTTADTGTVEVVAHRKELCW